MLRTFRGGLLIGLAVAVAVAAGAIAYERYDTKTLKRTVKRGEVLCGVNKGLPGFSIPDDKGDWTGFDVDFCRAVAAAIFDDPEKAKFVPLDANERFKELQSRKVDILSRNSTWSMSRECNYDLYFPAVAYYDGQGFMLPLRARSIRAGPEQQQGLRAGGDHNAAQPRGLFPHQQHEIYGDEFSRLEEVRKAYKSASATPLPPTSPSSTRSANLSEPADHVILPDVISKEPLAPVVRQRDDDWMMIVKWTLYAMINAEELGVASKNIDEALKSKKPDVMPWSALKALTVKTSVSPRIGPPASFATLAITARSMSAMLAPNRG